MSLLWKKKPFLGFGIGMGVLGALALALRHSQKYSRSVPDAISPAIFSTRSVSTSRGEIVYHTSGSGDPVVFLHGFFLGASSYEWSKIYPLATLRHEVIAPDLIGFGESERPLEALDADSHVESLAEFLRGIVPARPAVIVASGTTANLCLILSARHPELVSRLILFLPTELKDARKARTMGLIGKSRIPGVSGIVYRRHLAQPSFIKTWLESYGFSNPEKLTAETVSVLVTCAQQYGAEHAIFGFIRNRHGFDVARHLPGVMAPVHILWPSQAAGFHPSEAVNLCRHIPRATMEILPGASAFAPIESPGETGEVVSRWIDGDLTVLQST
ncbi:MAG: alpha/beta hydrolase [bacterium]